MSTLEERAADIARHWPHDLQAVECQRIALAHLQAVVEECAAAIESSADYATARELFDMAASHEDEYTCHIARMPLEILENAAAVVRRAGGEE